MCYYSSISVGFKIIETRFGVKFLQSEYYQPVFSASAFTFPLMPVITNEKPNLGCSHELGIDTILDKI
jgi:hypothetical protein